MTHRQHPHDIGKLVITTARTGTAAHVTITQDGIKWFDKTLHGVEAIEVREG